MGHATRKLTAYLILLTGAIGASAYLFDPPLDLSSRQCFAPPREPKTYTRATGRDIASLPQPQLVQVDSTTAYAVLHLDQYGLIVQSDGDGGDTAQRTGMFYFMHRDEAGFTRALEHLEVSRGVYVRHPFQSGFRSDPKRFSRDQQRPLVIALGAYGMRERLWDLFEQHALRLGKYQNLDYLGPVNIGEYIRAFQATGFYPVLAITDLALLFGSIDRAIKSHLDPDDVGDDNNHLLTLIQAQQVMPTPFSFLARKSYKLLRAKNLGNSEFGESDAVQGALAWYHRIDSGGNTLIAETYREPVDQL